LTSAKLERFNQSNPEMNSRTLTRKVSRSLLTKVKSEPVEIQQQQPASLDIYAFKQENKLDVYKDEPTSSSSVAEASKKRLKWEPDNWQEQYNRIKTMRADMSAPVDTCGCDVISSQDPNLPEKVKRYHVLVSLMLSAQTKDQVTAAAMVNLNQLPLTIDNFLAADDQALEKCIYPVCFYKRKVQAIKNTSRILKEKYDSDIPDNVNELMKLPGVGPKMAYSNICTF